LHKSTTKILVTGGRGFIGSCLMHELEKRGQELSMKSQIAEESFASVKHCTAVSCPRCSWHRIVREDQIGCSTD
jgi:UDP-glucose 4-epimerase